MNLHNLAKYTMYALFSKIEDIALEFEKALGRLDDTKKLKTELSPVFVDIDNIEKALDALIDHLEKNKQLDKNLKIDISDIDELIALSDKKTIEDYCRFLHSLRHDIVDTLVMAKKTFTDIGFYANKPDFIARELERAKRAKDRICALILSLGKDSGEGPNLNFLLSSVKSIGKSTAYPRNDFENKKLTDSNKKILLVDDDKNFSFNLASLLSESGYHVDITDSFESGVDKAKNNFYDAYILDINLSNSGADGFSLGDVIKNKSSKTPIIIVSNSKSNSPVTRTLEHKFDHFFAKTIGYNELAKKIVEILSSAVTTDIRNVSMDLKRHGIITKSKKMIEILTHAANLKDSSNILIEGESGTGKELAAAYLGSILAPDGPFVVVNCPAIPESLMESILFGHVKGAFTGAERDVTGKFEEAENGVVFLDEISSASMSLQQKLLRVIQNQEIEKVGSAKKIKCNVKIIAATNENLQQKVAKNEFREDLFFRLKRHSISLLPLRERKEDIEPLIAHFAKDKYEKFTESVIIALGTYSWRGNVRELENLVYDLLVKTKYQNKIILRDILPLFESSILASDSRNADITEMQVLEYLTKESEKRGLLNYLKTLEEQIINAELKKCKNFSECSYKLKIDPSGLSKKIKRYNNKECCAF